MAAGSEQGTPLRSSFQREDVGPGRGQVQDPNLHEQFFGVDDDLDVDADLPGPSGGQHPFYHHDAPGPHYVQDYERGHLDRYD